MAVYGETVARCPLRCLLARFALPVMIGAFLALALCARPAAGLAN